MLISLMGCDDTTTKAKIYTHSHHISKHSEYILIPYTIHTYPLTCHNASGCMKAGNLSCEFKRNAAKCYQCRHRKQLSLSSEERRDEMKIRLYQNFSISFPFYSILFTMAFEGLAVVKDNTWVLNDANKNGASIMIDSVHKFQ